MPRVTKLSMPRRSCSSNREQRSPFRDAHSVHRPLEERYQLKNQGGHHHCLTTPRDDQQIIARGQQLHLLECEEDGTVYHTDTILVTSFLDHEVFQESVKWGWFDTKLVSYDRALDWMAVFSELKSRERGVLRRTFTLLGVIDGSPKGYKITLDFGSKDHTSKLHVVGTKVRHELAPAVRVAGFEARTSGRASST